MSMFRRIMLGGGIHMVPDTQKLYYKSSIKLTPRDNPFNSPIMDHIWNHITGDGVIICINDITIINDSAFIGERLMTNIIIPNSLTSIDAAAFRSCEDLQNITFPNNVISIGNGAFAQCISMEYYDFSSHETIPILGNDRVFSDIPSTCKIIVPDSLYDEWIVAEHWTEYTSNIIKKSDWDNLQTT